MNLDDSIRVLVVDDHPMFRQGVVHALGAQPGLAVVGEGGSGEEALSLVQALAPDVVLLDISMPGQDGLGVVRQIMTACPSTAVVMLTMSEDKDKLLSAFKGGARAYVLKGVSGRQLAEVVRSVARGEVYVTPSLAAEMMVSMTHGSAPDPLQELTAREREVLGFIGAGLTNREIGERIYLSEKTVKHYVTNILQKLQVRSRVEAALLAAKHVRS